MLPIRSLVSASAFVVMSMVGRFGVVWSDEPPAVSVQPGQSVDDMIHRGSREWYQFRFPASGMAVVEVSGFPADCALQIGSQGFQESASSPVDWTDGKPGQTVSHSFRVQAGRPGRVWVELRSRASGVSVGDWSGVICSNNGPCYTLPERGQPLPKLPAGFEGRPVQGPIRFRLAATMAGTQSDTPPPSPKPDANSSSTDATQPFRDEMLGFGFDYPPGWNAVGVERGTYRVKGQDGAMADAPVTIQVFARSTHRKTSLLEEVLAVHNSLANSGAQVTKMGPTKVAGAEAMFANHIIDNPRDTSGRTVSIDHAFVAMDYGPNRYLVTFTAPHDVFIKETPAMKHILNTWRFHEPAGNR